MDTSLHTFCGRTQLTLALGLLIASDSFESLNRPAEEIFMRALQGAEGLKYIRGMANTIIGLKYFLEKNPFHNEAFHRLRVLTEKMIAMYRASCDGASGILAMRALAVCRYP